MNWMTKPRRAIALFVLAVPAATLSIILYLGIHVRKSAYDDAVAQQRVRGHATADYLEHEVGEMQRDLEFLAQNPLIADLSSAARIDRSLNGIPEGADMPKRRAVRTFLNKYHHFTVISLVLPSGDHYMVEPFALQKKVRQYNLSDRPYIREILRTKTTTLSDSFTGADGKPVVVIATPVLDKGGEITAIVIGVFYLEKLSYLVDSSRIGSGRSAFIVDRKSRLVTSSDKALLRGDIKDFSGHPLVVQYRAQLLRHPADSAALFTTIYQDPSTGERHVGTFVPLSTGWGLGISRSLQELYAPLYRDMASSGLFLVVVMSVLGWLGFVIIDRSVRSVQAAERTALTEKAFSDSVMNTLPGVFFLIDGQRRMMRWNNNLETLTGYSPEELRGMSPEDFVQDEARALFTEKLQEVLAGEQTSVEVSLPTKGGDRIPYHFTASPFVSSGARYVVAVGLDLSELRTLQEQILQSQKMESIGHLAGGVAHDFNNLLTAILGYGGMLQAALAEDDPRRRYVHHVLASGARASELTKSLLAFSRKQVIRPEPRDLNDTVKGMEKILRRIIGEDIELRTSLFDGTLTVMVDRGQMDQVIMNLATNARDAMPGGGLLSIETGLFHADDSYAKMHLFDKPGLYASLAITDTGMGMDEKTRERIFEPFFTTKELGRGTGLGLAIVYSIVKQHNGSINVYSEQVKGTTFKIYLPLTKQAAAVEAEKLPPPRGGTETVLVAEDEEEVRLLLRMVLEAKGYRVLEAENGAAAVDVYTARKDEIGLLLFDVVMPKKNGRQAYEEITQAAPDLKVIFMSGYTDNILHLNGSIEKKAPLIQKPLDLDELLRTVRAVLDGERGEADASGA